MLPLAPPLGTSVEPRLAALPKADIHVHQEWSPRLDRVLARRNGRPVHQWRDWASTLMADVPAGMPRLAQLSSVFPAPPEADLAPENFVARLQDLLEEAAVDGAVLVELRFGGTTALLHPNFMALLREAEHRVRRHYPALHAEALYTLLMHDEPARLERVVAACLGAAGDGLSGIDFLYQPYDQEAQWIAIYHVAERALAVGLGISAHAGEFSAANIAAALRTPGLTRLGHAVHAARDPRLLDLVAAAGVTVECCLSCNIVLGAVPSYEEHPIRTFVAAGIPVALGTDDPVQLTTTIGREYALAHALGFSLAQLQGLTANAIRASFASPACKAAMLAALEPPQPLPGA